MAEWDEEGLGGHAGGVDVFLVRAVNGCDARRQVKWNVDVQRIRRRKLEDPDRITVYPVKEYHTLKRPAARRCECCDEYFRIKRVNQKQCWFCEKTDKKFD